MSSNRHLSADYRPTSAQLEQLHIRHSLNQRPVSEQNMLNYKSPEAQDKWFEDLSYYERTLEEMSNTKLDDNFKEELTAIENWFRVLTDPERTACLYSLLKGTTPLQIRFFITVLQQMAAKDAAIDPLSASILLSSQSRNSTSSVRTLSTTSEELGRLYARPNSNGRLSTEYTVRAHSLLRSSSSQDDFEYDESLSPTKTGIFNGASKKDTLGTDWSIRVSQRTSSLNVPMITEALTKQHINTLPLPAEEHGNIQNSIQITSPVSNDYRGAKPIVGALHAHNIQPRQIGGSLPKPREPHHDEEWDSNGVTISRDLGREKVKPTEVIDLKEIQDIPTWFRSLRLHKYTTIFENEDWRDIIKMTEDELLAKGVAALGARRKMLKVFEAARIQLDAQGIRY